MEQVLRTKVNEKAWKYAQEIEPDRDTVTLYVEKMLNCGVYLDEYQDCKSSKERRYQRYVYGDKIDCEYLNETFKTCEHYVKTDNKEAKNYLIDYELAKRDYRMAAARANDVWEYRTTPYREWDMPGEAVDQEEITDEKVLSTDVQNLNYNNKNDQIEPTKSEDSAEQSKNQEIQTEDKLNQNNNNSQPNVQPNVEQTVSTGKGMCAIS